MDLSVMCYDHKEWVRMHFPTQTPQDGALRVAGEAGELAQAVAKRSEALRGLEYIENSGPSILSAAQLGQRDRLLAVVANQTSHIEDAVGDVFLALASFCQSEGLDLTKTVAKVMKHVHARGRSENDPLKSA